VSDARISTRRRGRVGPAVGAGGLAALTLVLWPARDHASLATVTLLYLVPVLAAAVSGGLWPALVAAVAADLLVNFFFVEPIHTLTVSSPANVAVLVVYVLVAATVAVAVDVAARQRATALRQALETRLLAQVTTVPVVPDSLVHLVERVRAAYHMETVAVLDAGTVLARAGDEPDGAPVLDVDSGRPGLRLVAWGAPVFAEDRRTLARMAAAAARIRDSQELAEDARRVAELAEIDRLRAALLDAVGHDLRTPLAGIKAAVSSLRQPDVEFSDADRAELLATVEQSTDRLTDLVENLLSLSRLRAGVLSVQARPVAVDAVVAAALLHTPGGAAVDLAVPDDLPLALVDPGLLERVVANLLANALSAGVGHPVHVVGTTTGDRLLLRVVDHGPGLPTDHRDRMFAPFQRFDDHGAGLGLGLAIARGFTEAMGGTLVPTDTAGGGLTMTITVPVARP
jgi:K+-sensing histidine kinase KdpD